MYTQFVKSSIFPCLLIFAGLSMGEIFLLLAVVGGIWEAFNVAKLLDAKPNKPEAELKLPSLD